MRVTSDDFLSAFDDISDKALREPVIVTRQGQDALVVVAVEECRRLSQRDRVVGATEDLSGEWLEAVLEAEVPAEYDYLNAELD